MMMQRKLLAACDSYRPTIDSRSLGHYPGPDAAHTPLAPLSGGRAGTFTVHAAPRGPRTGRTRAHHCARADVSRAVSHGTNAISVFRTVPHCSTHCSLRSPAK